MRYVAPLILCTAMAFAVAPTRAADSAAVAVKYPEVVSVGLALKHGEFDALHAQFDPAMAAAVPKEQLGALWTQIVAQLGPLTGVERTSPVDVTQTQTAKLIFQKGELQLLLAMDSMQRITGLRIVPMAPSVAPVQPLAATDTIAETAVKFAAVGGPEMVGTLTLPKNVVNPPAVVLVHGSGPHDRYETVGGNRPFLDLARGLARQGIAVLAYDKRTLTHAKDIDLNTLTIDQETTDDGLAAAKWLRESGKVDAKRVFLLGHSQGALVTPRALNRDGLIRGGILLAGPAGRLLDLLPHQNRTMLGDAVGTPEGKAQLAMLDSRIALIRNPETPGTEKALGQPVSYWRSVDAVVPLEDANTVKQPMLILQGEKDFQVIEQDWGPWRPFAAARPSQVTFKLYPELNHLGNASQGKKGMEDYVEPRPVDAGLIKDIADWIKNLKPKT